MASSAFSEGARISEIAANVSWQLMVGTDEGNEALRRDALSDGIRVCDVLEAARDVIADHTLSTQLIDQPIGQAVKRRLIDSSAEVEPIFSEIGKVLPQVRKLLSSQTISADEVRFLQREFAALSITLQERGL